MASPTPSLPDVRDNWMLNALVKHCAVLAESLEQVSYPVGHVIAHQDQAISHVYFPLAGTLLSLIVPLQEGGSAEAMVISNEGMVGVCVWLGVKNHLTDVIQQGAGPLLRITARAFCQGVDGCESASALLKRFTAFSLRSGYQTAVCNAHHSVEQRVCRWLLDTEDRVGASNFRLSHAMLAHMLGARRQSIGEVALKLQRDAIITYQRTQVRVLDRQMLESRSCECYGSLRLAQRTLMMLRR